MKAYADAPVRFRDDLGFEFRCPTCRTFWPLSKEFWYPRRGMRRCIACLRAADARNQRERYLRSTTHRERRIVANRRYRLARARAKWDNTGVGSSDNPANMHATPFGSLTLSGGVAASRGQD